jgi:tellurium resistance protein TerD
MTGSLVKGGNTVLTSGGHQPRAVSVGVRWANSSADIDLCALLCAHDRKVVSDLHFLFWDNPQSPQLDAFVLGVRPGQPSPREDRAQCLLNLEALPSQTTNVFVSLSTIVEGASLVDLGQVELRVVDVDTGEVITRYTRPSGYAEETCVVLAEVYRHKGAWKLRIIDQGYAGGLAALGRDYGVDIA